MNFRSSAGSARITFIALLIVAAIYAWINSTTTAGSIADVIHLAHKGSVK